MRVIKFYGWEPSFLKQVEDIRKDETAIARTLANVKGVMLMLFGLNPVVMQVAMFFVYALVHPEGMSGLAAPRAFFAISMSAQLIMPLLMLPNTVNAVIQARIRLARVQVFLLSEEVVQQQEQHSECIIQLRSDALSWDGNAPILRNIDLTIRRGTLTAIIGETGSGKSSPVSAILGDMSKGLHERTIKGTVAYVPQQAWIFNATIRDNITFGLPFDEKRYRMAIEKAQLKHDLAQMPGKDETEIGERGVNLSGGQRQRVSIARAFYADADVLIFDDPLSALDAHVGAKVFHAIRQAAAVENKTVMFVTNQLQFVSSCDNVAVVRAGTIAEFGSPSASHNTGWW